MAVPQNRTSRSKRDMRRMHDKLTAGPLSVEQETGEKHRRHHISPEGYYRGRQVLVNAAANDDSNDNDTE